MLDRAFHAAGVVDFVDVGIYSVRWPAFNVADSVLSIGMILFLVSLMYYDDEIAEQSNIFLPSD